MMGDNVRLEDEDVYYNLSSQVESTKSNVDSVHEVVEELLHGTDARVRQYYRSHFDAISSANYSLSRDSNQIADVSKWLNETTSDYVATKSQTQGIAGGAGGSGDGYSSYSPSPAPATIGSEKMYIDPEKFNELPADVKQQIISALQEDEFTDEEINKIITGKWPIDKATTETLKKVLEDLAKDNKDIIKLLEKTAGFPIFDENGNVDIDRLAIAEIIAGKNLGMDIDMTPGSPFRVHINKLSREIEDIYKDHPEIRQEIIDKYGVDIFDENGKVDPEKLALLRVIDGQDLKDDYDITKITGAYQKSTENTTTPDTGVSQEPSSPPTGPADNGDNGNQTPDKPDNGDGQNGDKNETQPTGPVITTGPENTVTPIPGVINGNNTTGPFGMDGHNADGMAASLTDGLGAAGKGIIDAIGKGTSKFTSGISPFKIGSNAGVGTNKAAAGIIAAASIAAGGAATGGGILLHKKVSTLRFTPEDWNALGEDYQGIIEKLMKTVGFTEDEIETFKNSKFKIATTEMREHTSKIEKALDSNPTCDDELLKLYDYSFLDDNGKVIDYLLFITMIIDGKNSIDDYNMYNVINQSFDNVDEADFIYSGIAMEDYFDESSDDEEEDEEGEQLSEDDEVKILNDPTTTDYNAENNEEAGFEETKKEEEEEKEELEEENSAVDKEWLKGIGIID